MTAPYSRVRQKAAELLRVCPMAVSAAFIISAILPFYILPVGPASLSCMIPVLAGLLFFPSEKVLIHGALPAFAGAISAALMFHSAAHDPLDACLGRDFCYAEAEITVLDPSASSVLEPESIPANLLCQVDRFRWSPQAEWIDGRHARIFLQIRDREAGKIIPGYGDRLMVSGSFRKPTVPAFGGSFDFQQWMFRKRVSRQFLSDRCLLLEQGSGVRRTLYDVRDGLFNRSLRPMRDPGMRAVAAGMIFGRKSGIRYETKQAFLRSGAIHLLSVSGTHIGIAAWLFLLLFRPLPYRAGRIAMLVSSLLYAMSTGMAEPAFRAWMMLAVFCFTGLFLLKSSNLNSLCAAACVLLILDPGNLINPGFLFSFLTVAALLLSAGLGKELRDPDPFWIPSAYRNKHAYLQNKLKRNAWQAVLACLIAFAVTMPLSMFWQGLFLPASILANLLLLPLTGLIFATFMGTVFSAAFLPFLNGIFVGLLEFLLKLMLTICDRFAALPLQTLPQPSIFSIILFLSLLFFFLLTRDFRCRCLALSAAAAILIWWHFVPFTQKPETAVFSGGGCEREISVVSISPAAQRALIVNVPDMERALELCSYLQSRGIGTADVMIPYSRKGAYNGIRYLNGRIAVRNLLIPNGLGKNVESRADRVLFFDGNRNEGSYRSGTFTAQRKNRECSFYALFPDSAVELNLKTLNEGPTVICGSSGSGFPIPNAQENCFQILSPEITAPLCR